MAKVWLWHDECKEGKVHDKRDEAQLCKSGWCDSPAKLGQPRAAEADAEAATATPEAEAEAAIPDPEPENAEPEASEPEPAGLLDLYKESSALLDDQEVLTLARELGLAVQSNMKRETIESKINDAI